MNADEFKMDGPSLRQDHIYTVIPSI